MDIIRNEFEAPIEEETALNTLQLHLANNNQIVLSDLSSQKLDVCENAIRLCDSFSGVATLAAALGVHHIISNQLYRPEYQTSAEYFADSDNRLHMDRKKVSRLNRIGDAYFQNRKRLTDYGFRPEGDVSKLEFLENAIANHGERESIKALCKMSVREFQEYSRGDAGTPKTLDFTRLNLKVEMTETGISVEGKEVITVAAVKKIVDSGAEPYLFALDSPGEKRAVDNFLKKFRENK